MSDSQKNNNSHTLNTNIKTEPAIKNLLSRMPINIADSFSEEQLTHLMTAIGSRSWGKHAVDKRGTFKIPLYKWRFYYVVLFGKNYRELSRKEKHVSLITSAIFSTLFLLFCATLGLLIIYLIKSALGIDLISGYSFGIWTWFKGLW